MIFGFSMLPEVTSTTHPGSMSHLPFFSAISLFIFYVLIFIDKTCIPAVLCSIYIFKLIAIALKLPGKCPVEFKGRI
jgi:hypothetical protein